MGTYLFGNQRLGNGDEGFADALAAVFEDRSVSELFSGDNQ